MANPADDLYEIFKYWRSVRLANGKIPGETKITRQLKHNDKEEIDKAWARQRKAARCLEAIAQIIDRMEEAGDNVESERGFFKEWTYAVYAYPNGWNTSGSGVTDSAFNTLGLFRNSARRFLPDVGDNFLDELRGLLENEPELTPPPGHYPVELFDYFTRVKHHLRWCIDHYELTSQFDLQRAAEEYRAAVFMMANGGFVTNPKDWAEHAVRTFGLKIAKRFGTALFNEAENQLTQSMIRAVGGMTKRAIEGG